MNSLRGAAAAIVVPLLVLGGGAARAEVLSLSEVQESAANADAVAVATARAEESNADLDSARAVHHPVVNLNTDASVSPGGQLVDVTGVDGQHYLVQGSRTISQPGAFLPTVRFGAIVSGQLNVYDFGRSAARVAAAEHRLRASRLAADAIRAENVRLATEAYLSWVVATARHAVVERHAVAVRAQGAALRDAIEEGARPPADALAADQAETAVEAEGLDAQNALERAAEAVRQWAPERWRPTSTPDLRLLDQPPAPHRDRAEYDAAAMAEQSDASHALAESLRREHVPILSASGDLGARGQNETLFPLYRLGVALTMPLWDGGVAAAQRRAAQAQAEELQAQARSLTTTSRDAARLARQEAARLTRRVELSSRSRSLAEQDFVQMRERFRLGAIDVRPVLDALDRLSRAETDEVSAKGEWARAMFRAGP
jgi:outer membrane protein TolC